MIKFLFITIKNLFTKCKKPKKISMYVNKILFKPDFGSAGYFKRIVKSIKCLSITEDDNFLSIIELLHIAREYKEDKEVMHELEKYIQKINKRET